MTNSLKGKLIQWGAIAIDVGVPMAVTFTQLPVWVYRSSTATVSGLFVICALICSIPMLRHGAPILRNPSAPVVWGILLAIFLGLNSIVDEMLYITGFGFGANIIGSIIYKVGERIEHTEDAPEEETEE